MADIRVAVIGAGIIGRTHIETLERVPGMRLAAIVEPSAAGAEIAAARGVPHFAALDDLRAGGGFEAAVVASPNHTHVAIARELIEAGIPVLLEKPVAATVETGLELLKVVGNGDVPLLVGHHRRHNPIIKAAKKAIGEGAIGSLVMANVSCALMKPPAYFDVPWRSRAGQGGVLHINLIHEVDLLRHFFGEIASVRGVASNAVRGLEVEDTAAAIVTFRSGGMAALAISDAAAGPWAWDLTCGENPGRFPVHDTIAHVYAGSKGGLSLPDLKLWTYSGAPDWTRKMEGAPLAAAHADPYVAQLEHFGDLIRNGGEPLVSCEDGVRNMQVIEAIIESSASGREVRL